MSDGNHIEVETKIGRVAIWGKDIMMFLMVLAIGWLVYHELREIRCMVALSMWSMSVEHDPARVGRMPSEYYNCLPNFYIKRP